MNFYNAISDSSNFIISFTSNPEQDFGVFAKGYALAASTLAEQLLEKSHFSNYEAYPVVFLYRHAFELYLKNFYHKSTLISAFKDGQPVNNSGIYTHSLVPLAEIFQKISAVLFPNQDNIFQLTTKVIRFATEFQEIDSHSFGYRYPINKKGDHSTKHHQIVNLLALHQSMQELFEELEIIDFGFDIEAYKAQEVYKIIAEAEALRLSQTRMTGKGESN